MCDSKKTEYRRVIITDVQQLNDDYFIIETENGAIEPQPGQFYLLKPATDTKILLHLPVSIYRFKENKLQFLFKKIGYGTEYLSEMKQGEFLKVLGPLGNQFPLVSNKQVLFISGGIGYAPLPYLKEELDKRGNQVIWIHGGRSEKDVFPADYICTEDGCRGIKGLVTDNLLSTIEQNRIEVIYTCGPKAMLKHLSQLINGLEINCYVSLEEYMACGLGACLGCVVPIMENNSVNYKTVCNDGPIFLANEVVWDE